MATKVAAAGGGNWSSTSTWVGGAVPTAADDVQLNSSSGNVTIDSAAVCRSLDCTGGGVSNYTGTLTHSAGISLTIGDATAGLANSALAFSPGMTYTLGSATTSAINFVSTSVTVQTLTTAGKTLGNITFNAASGGSWRLADGLNTGSSTAVTLTKGSLDFNGQTCSIGSFSSTNSNTRSVTLGAASITCAQSFGGAWSFSIATGLTFNAGTSTITFTGNSCQMYPGPFAYNNVVFSGAGSPFIGNASLPTFANLTRTGTNTKTDTFGLNVNITVTGTFTVTGNSAINRILVQAYNSNTASAGVVQRTITVNGSVQASNADFQDIAGAGTASWNLASATGGSGDCGGNSNITFTTGATQVWAGTSGGNWSGNTWSGGRVPLPQDDVTISSAFAASQTITYDMPRLGRNINYTGATGNPTYSLNSIPTSIYGSYTLAAGMGVTGAQTLTFASRGSSTITTNGVTLPVTSLYAPGGTYTFTDDVTFGGNCSHTMGTATFNGNVTVATVFQFPNNGLTRVLNMGSGIWNFNNTAPVNIWNIPSSIGLTLNAGTSKMVLATASTNTRTFLGAGLSYNSLTYTVPNSPGTLLISGANTFNSLNVSGGRTLSLAASTTHSFSSFNVSGTSTGYIYLPAVSGNYVSSPNAAAVSITGDIDLRAKVAPSTWTPASVSNSLVGKWASGQKSYVLQIAVGSGKLRLAYSLDGTTTMTVDSSVAVGLSPGSLQWVRAVRTAATGSVVFYVSSDGSSWIALGAPVNGTAGNIFASTSQVEMGSTDNGTLNFLTGAIYQAQIRNNTADDGTGIVFNADFSTKAVASNSFAETSANQATVTVNGSLAQVSDGQVALTSTAPGTTATLSKTSGTVSSDYLSIQDSAATGGAAWYAGGHSVSISNVSGWNFATPPAPSSAFIPFFN